MSAPSGVAHPGGQHALGRTTIDTYTCRSIDLADPSSGDVDLRDIARGLAMTVRFAGQVERFYSVAEHSVVVYECAVVEGADPDAARYALLHDAAEAYIGDVVAPLKRAIGPAYGEIEARWEAVILERFGVPTPTPDVAAYVKDVDMRARYAEGAVLKPREETWRGKSTPLPRRCRQPSGVEWRTAERLFLNACASEDIG